MNRQINGLFLGLSTIDLQYLVSHPPRANEKIVAKKQTLSAGGPATNACKTFSALGGSAELVSHFGENGFHDLFTNDLAEWKIKHHDLGKWNQYQPSISSITINESTGERTVVSINAENLELDFQPEEVTLDHDFLLLDGHLMNWAIPLAQKAQERNIPVIFDGGSWKEHTEQLLNHVDVAICSGNFHPPETRTHQEVLQFLSNKSVKHSAITQGDAPILLQNYSGELETMSVEKISPVDTLGAGDIFHGAFCWYYSQKKDFSDSLHLASKVATESCHHFGVTASLQAIKSQFT